MDDGLAHVASGARGARLRNRHAAVDRQRLAHHIARAGASEPEHSGRNLVGSALQVLRVTARADA